MLGNVNDFVKSLIQAKIHKFFFDNINPKINVYLLPIVTPDYQILKELIFIIYQKSDWYV